MSPKKTGIITSSLCCILLLLAVMPFQFGSIADFDTINGTSLVAPRNSFTAEELAPVVSIGSDWIAIIPYAFSSVNSPSVTFNYRGQYWGESSQGVLTSIDYAKSLGLKVLIKPHIWVREQGWPGDFELHSDEDWEVWEKDYTEYILTYARIAEEKEVELFAVGTEYRKLVSERPEVWRRIIKKIRGEYSGNITYAANWDNYENVKFWDAVDFIGIDAYFDLDESKTPSVEDITKSWLPIKQKLKTFSDSLNTPILFTEYGYQSIDYATAGHWKFDTDTLEVNYQAQANAYEALYQTFWNEDWFKGGFLWKWHLESDLNRRGRYSMNTERLKKRFTPQGKLAEDVIKDWYSK